MDLDPGGPKTYGSDGSGYGFGSGFAALVSDDRDDADDDTLYGKVKCAPL